MFFYLWGIIRFFGLLFLFVLVGISLGRNRARFICPVWEEQSAYCLCLFAYHYQHFQRLYYYIYYRYIYTYSLSFCCLVVWFIGLYGGLYIFTARCCFTTCP